MAPDNPDKLRDLSARLKKARGDSPDSDQPATNDNNAGIAFGLRAGLELVVALLVGFALGYFLDGALGTRPLLMIIFGFLGLAAGVSNIYRLFSKMDMAVGYKKPPDKASDSSKKS